MIVVRVRDFQKIPYRSLIQTTDAHKSKVNSFSTELSYLTGTVRPEMLKADIRDVGSVITGNVILNIPILYNPDFSIKYGDGVYLDGDDTEKPPQWFVSNHPVKGIKHYILLLKNKV